MKISDFSVERPVTIVMVTLLVVLIGSVSLTKLPVNLLPELDLPFAVVFTSYEGAGPKQIEKTVTRPIEESIATVDNVKRMISISNSDRSLVIVNFEWGTKLNFATLDMRENISLLEGRLPDGAGNPRVLQFDPTQMPIMRIGLSGASNLQRMKSLAEDIFKPSLERLSGVASVNISGGLERRIKVKVDQEKMLAHNLSLQQISSSIRQSNLNLAGGTIRTGGKELLIKTVGEFESVQQLRELEFMTRGGQKVSLQEIAAIRDTTAEVEQYTYLNGKRSIGLAIQKQSGANTVKVAEAVKEELKNLNQQVEAEVNLEIVRNQAEFIQEAINNVKRNALVGAALAVFVLLLFLRDLRTTLIIGTAIPISIVVAFTLMYFADLTLNLMTLGGIALGIGMLVDNAIVVLENIYRHRQESESRILAAKHGTAEVGTAIIASTLTTAAVFLPIVYIEGLASQIFGSLALTVTFSLLASLGVALTLIPMLSSKLLTVKNKFSSVEEEFEFTGIKKTYQQLLEKALNWRYLVVVLVIIGISVVGIGVKTGFIPLESQFMPKTDQGAFTVDVQLAQGTILAETKQVIKRIEGQIKKIPEVDVMYSTVGGGGSMMGGSSSNEGQISVQLVGLSQRDRSTSKIVEELRSQVKDIAGADININAQTSVVSGGSSGRAPIEVKIQGSDVDRLTKLAQKISAEVKQVKGTRNVDTSLSDNRTEIQVNLKRELATELGFNVSQVAATVKTAVKGQVVTRYKEAGEEYDVELQLQNQETNSIHDLRNLQLTSPQGMTVPLAQIAEIEIASGLTRIERENQQRIVRVMTDFYDRSLSAVQSDIQQRVNQEVNIPIGYTVKYGGQVEDMRQAFGDLGFALIMAIVLVYMVMASQFESLVHPLTIMFTVPLALIGAILGLAVIEAPLSVPAIIGMVMLAGIVVNNAIVMVDYINTRREEKEEARKEAILKAGPVRLRPIMMTTLTTILGLFPIAIGIGQGAEIQQPMAVVVVGGLLFSTLLTLVILPSFYSVFDDLAQFLTKIVKRFLHGEEAEQIES